MKLSAFIALLKAELRKRGDVNIWDWDPCGGWTAPDIDRNEPTIGDVVLSGNHPPREGTQ